MKKSILIIILVLICSVPTLLFPQQIKEIEFEDQEITDILVALAQMGGISIVPDETVQGRVSYHFYETDFNTALNTFLKTFKMYSKKEGNIYYVSKIQTQYEPSLQMITLNAEDVEISLLLRAISETIEKTVLYDSLPSELLTVHVKNVTPDKLLRIIIKRFPEYALSTDKDFYYIKRIPEPREAAARKTGQQSQIAVYKTNNLYSISAEKARFIEVIDELFLKAGYEHSLLIKKDLLLEKVRYKNKDFEQMLRLVLDQANADYKKVGDVYYIFEVTQNDILKKLKSTIKIQLVNLNVKTLPKLLPTELALTKFYKIDTDTNSIILSGSLEEIDPIQKFIKAIDIPTRGQAYYRYDLNYISIKNLKSLLPASFSFVDPISLPNSNSFVILLSAEKKKELDQYLQLIDKSSELECIKLKYIKADTLKKHLPPSMTSEDIIETGNPSIIFVKGSPQKLDEFHEELSIIDRPVPQLRYEVLVIQYQETNTLGINQNLEGNVLTVQNPPAEGATDAFIGSVGNLLTLNFDTISTFGAQFALQLNAELDENKASVLADTTLNGISEEEIKFRNTSTFRYREYQINPNTGELDPTGVVREIQNGLLLNIKGWVSGDGMITMDIEAEISRRETGDISNIATYSPPTTYEKQITTHIRSPVGKPLVIGGLVEQVSGITTQSVPFFGDIPLIGILFKSEKETTEFTEFVIYIVPHVDLWEGEEPGVRTTLERLYNKFGQT